MNVINKLLILINLMVLRLFIKESYTCLDTKIIQNLLNSRFNYEKEKRKTKQLLKWKFFPYFYD
jgi:hypothetical protein